MEDRDTATSSFSTSREQTLSVEDTNNNTKPQPADQNLAASLSLTYPPSHPLAGYPVDDDDDNSDDDHEIASSEPTLRFPRPQGNKRLAHWISASDPNIMEPTAENNSDSGLAGSTYEFIDREDGAPRSSRLQAYNSSQDESHDVFDESVSESVGSLDQSRQDDVHSIASTDRMDEDEEYAYPHHFEYEHDDASTAPDDEGSRLTDVPATDQDGKGSPTLAEEDQDHSEAESHSSIEYTRQSLGTPSILTPEGSKILSLPHIDSLDAAAQPASSAAKDDQLAWSMLSEMKTKCSDAFATYVPPLPPAEDKKAMARYREEHMCAWAVRHCIHTFLENPKQISLGLAVLILSNLILMYQPALNAQYSLSPPTRMPESSTSTVIIPATTSTPAVKPSATTKTGIALVPLYESGLQPSFFSTKKPSIEFDSDADNDLTVYFSPPDILRQWQVKPECFEVTASRADNLAVPLSLDFSQSRDALHVLFDKSAAHGVVQVRLSSTCRPKFETMVKVHFNKGLTEKLSGCLTELAQFMSGVEFTTEPVLYRCPAFVTVPREIDRQLTAVKDNGVKLVTTGFHSTTRMMGSYGDSLEKAAREADRRLDQATKMLKTVSDYTEPVFSKLQHQGGKVAEKSMLSAGKALGIAANSVTNGAKIALQKASASQKAHQAQLKQAVAEMDVRSVQKKLRFGLLDAQVGAKIWWLRTTGRQEQSEEYRHRAKEFIDELRS